MVYRQTTLELTCSATNEGAQSARRPGEYARSWSDLSTIDLLQHRVYMPEKSIEESYKVWRFACEQDYT